MAEVAPNGFAHNPSLTSIDPVVSPPPEIEATLSRLSAYRNVRGVMILSRVRGSGENTGTEGGIVQSSGAVFDGESGKKYAKGVEGIVESVGSAVAACENGDEPKFIRIRTRRHELIITPDERYLLVILQDPGQ